MILKFVVCRTSPARYKFLRQGVSITGMSSPTFEKAVGAVHEFYGKFDRHFPQGQLEDWSQATYKDHSALDISNRYLTPKRDAPTAESIPFSKVVDPHGILEEMAKTGYIHSEENEVHYYRCLTDGDGTKR